MKTTLLIIVIAILLGILLRHFVRTENSKREKKLESAFSNRERLTPEQFYSRFFQQQDVPFYIVAGVQKILSKQLDADMSRLIDEDDFATNLRFFFDFDSMADVEIVLAIEKEFSIQISDAEVENCSTIKDIVNLVVKKKGK